MDSTDADMLWMVENGIREGRCHTIHRHVKPSNKHMKDYDKNKETSYLKYWDANYLFGWAMSLKLPIDGFKWVEDASQFVENNNKEGDEGYFLKINVILKLKLMLSWDVIWPSQRFTIFPWKNENWKSLKTCSHFSQ